jgi:mannitol operon repressor
MRSDDLNDLSRFLRELQTESDRGLALVGASVVDDKLGSTLRSFFVDCKAVPKLVDAASAPLGTFSSRVDVCLALGLIDQFEYDEITLIRKVRNEFAHGLHGTTFRTEPIAGLCSGLKSPLPEGAGYPTADPRFRFTNAVTSLVTRLYYRPDWVAKERRTIREWVTPDQVGWRSVENSPPPAGTPVLAIGKSKPSTSGES